MSKRNLCKKAIGICLVAMMAVAGVGTKANAAFFYDEGHMYGGCTAFSNKGTAYTVARSGYAEYGTVSAEYGRLSKDGEYFEYGASAGGVHGASVTVTYTGTKEPLVSYVESMHKVTTSYEPKSKPGYDEWSIYQ